MELLCKDLYEHGDKVFFYTEDPAVGKVYEVEVNNWVLALTFPEFVKQYDMVALGDVWNAQHDSVGKEVLEEIEHWTLNNEDFPFNTQMLSPVGPMRLVSRGVPITIVEGSSMCKYRLFRTGIKGKVPQTVGSYGMTGHGADFTTGTELLRKAQRTLTETPICPHTGQLVDITPFVIGEVCHIVFHCSKCWGEMT